MPAAAETRVRHWLHGYQRLGIAGLYDDPRSGRPRTHPWAGLVVETQASQSPPCSGHVQTCWSVGLLCAFLGRRFGIRLSGASLRRAVHRQGWRWARPRLAPVPRVDPEAEGKLAALAAAWTQVQAGQGQLLFVDESDLHLLPTLRSRFGFHSSPLPQDPTGCVLWRAGCPPASHRSQVLLPQF